MPYSLHNLLNINMSCLVSMCSVTVWAFVFIQIRSLMHHNLGLECQKIKINLLFLVILSWRLHLLNRFLWFQRGGGVNKAFVQSHMHIGACLTKNAWSVFITHPWYFTFRRLLRKRIVFLFEMKCRPSFFTPHVSFRSSPKLRCQWFSMSLSASCSVWLSTWSTHTSSTRPMPPQILLRGWR